MKSFSPVMPFPRWPAPPGVWVEQALPSAHIERVSEETCARLLSAGLRDQIRRGARIAITAGSRGIGGFIELVRGIADAVKSAGGQPFIIPAMGSHGGATVEGQTEILRRLGIDGAQDAPVHATMDTVALGVAANRAAAHMDRLAYESDGVIVLGRVKTHPESAGELASGLLKMCTIGLGKQRGAQEAHNHGLWESVREVPRLHLATGKILCGVAVVENGYRQPVEIEIVPPSYDAFLDADMRLLRVAKGHLARISFDRLNVLVVDELGKNISGAGMDPNIIGRWRNSDAPHVPDYHRIVVLSLTGPSLGNGLGIGMADFTTKRFMDAYDPSVSYVNLLTATEPGGNTREGPMPLPLPTDRDAIEVALYSSLAGDAPRLCRIKNTAELGRLWVSEALLAEVKADPKLSVVSELTPMPFHAGGDLL